MSLNANAKSVEFFYFFKKIIGMNKFGERKEEERERKKRRVKEKVGWMDLMEVEKRMVGYES